MFVELIGQMPLQPLLLFSDEDCSIVELGQMYTEHPDCGELPFCEQCLKDAHLLIKDVTSRNILESNPRSPGTNPCLPRILGCLALENITCPVTHVLIFLSA